MWNYFDTVIQILSGFAIGSFLAMIYMMLKGKSKDL
jgi:hypothetical protein